ncbi:hypothetical protein PMI07_001432 [Rhizobium sp. CF080]|uniref:tail fiber domain-containing protein n=1 Tax=Rhizobium sp. (strain CF080) TaxID=1144310 RepID=UPI0003E7F2E6|nr:tail fiber domain-containing protein [Rhizobium sp. CF080]EUB96533.1 hypothetical protein PMI07_001432 [Rhizobium sp. CF080]
MNDLIPRRRFLQTIGAAIATPIGCTRTTSVEDEESRPLPNTDFSETSADFVSGTLPFDTMKHFTRAFIPSIIKIVYIYGYYEAGDCPAFALFRLTAPPSPIEPWHKQTVDGGWWSYTNAANTNVRMFGARGLAMPADASINRTAIQNAINFKYTKGGGVVYAEGFFFIDDTIYRPSSVRLQGSVRHSVLREYGDTTNGVAHPISGTTFHTSGAGIPRLWTDESGNGSDALLRPLIAELGENGGVVDITLQTTRDASSWDIGLHICGVSRGFYSRLDIRGAWRKSACRMDATWGRDNPRMMALSHLPTWFDRDYAAIYDYGLTNNLFDFCRFEGACAFMVESGPNRAFAVNGISDTQLRACEFYHDNSAETRRYRETDGALIRLNYRLHTRISAQGLSFETCRYDDSGIWVFDIDHWSNLDAIGGRQFAETSNAWFSYQTEQGVPEYRARGRIRTTINTTRNRGDMLRFNGEFFCNISAVAADDDDNVRPRDWIPRAEAGKRIEFVGPGINNTFDFLSDGENGAVGLVLRSWRSEGRITLQSMDRNQLNSWGYFAANENLWGTAYDQRWSAGVVTFYRDDLAFLAFNGTNLISKPVYDDTTAEGANISVTSDGRLRRTSSALKYKRNIRNIPSDLSDRIMRLRPVLFNSTNKGDDPEKDFFGAIPDQAAEIGLDVLVRRTPPTEENPQGDIEDFDYAHGWLLLLDKVAKEFEQIDARLRALENRA